MKKILTILFVISGLVYAQKTAKNETIHSEKLYTEITKIINHVPENLIIVDANKQMLYLMKNGKQIEEYVISTGKAGTDSNAILGSLKTPVGLHQIAKKIGDSSKIGTIFRGQRNTNKIAKIVYNKKDLEKEMTDLVLTRVMVLDGKESSLNSGKNKKGEIVDSRKRGIYIHGTNNEAMIGSPASHGCIRMRNEDVVKFYNQVEVGYFLYIYK